MTSLPTERRSYDREIGDLSARMANVEKWLESVSTDVKAIRSTLDQQRGGWKMLATIGTLSGIFGGILTKLLMEVK